MLNKNWENDDFIIGEMPLEADSEGDGDIAVEIATDALYEVYFAIPPSVRWILEWTANCFR